MPELLVTSQGFEEVPLAPSLNLAPGMRISIPKGWVAGYSNLKNTLTVVPLGVELPLALSLEMITNQEI